MSAAQWQADMEDHLKAVRERTRLPRPSEASARLAQANATAALALAIALIGGDVEAQVTHFPDDDDVWVNVAVDAVVEGGLTDTILHQAWEQS